MRSSYFFAVLTILLLVVQSLVFVVLVSRYEKERNNFQVTRENFIDAVSKSVDKFLTNLSTNTPSAAVTSRNEPLLSSKLVFVDDLGTWFPDSDGRCIIDGVQYRKGDFCEYGLIQNIVPLRVYCLQSNEVVIVRGRMSGRAPVARPAAAVDDVRNAPL